MIAPQEWAEYESKYQRYGIDMRPAREPRERQKSQRVPLRDRGYVITVGRDRKVTLSVVLAGTVLFIMLIIMTAYSAALTFDINRAQSDINALNGEIESLEVQICEANNITYIEDRATGSLKMKNPGSSSCVYVSAKDAPEQGFADIIKEKAYN